MSMEKKRSKGLLFLVILIIAVAGLILIWNRPRNSNQPASVAVPKISQSENAVNNSAPPSSATQSSVSGFLPPLSRAGGRVTKKPFGIFITPQTSPVQPERFRGYHTGADFEIFPEELNAVVPVHAVCAGKLLAKKYATGYGGVAVESCTLNNQPITVIYGHLKLTSIIPMAGQNLQAGDTLGDLGGAYSSETNGERKHLHLGFHKGTAINILGYVQNQSELSGWIDPCLNVCHD